MTWILFKKNRRQTNDKRRKKNEFIDTFLFRAVELTDLIPYYGECSDTDCRTCEIGEVCRKSIELEDSIRKLEEKWEEK